MAWEKQASQKEAVKAFLVMNNDKVDVDASTAKYRAAALKLMIGQEAENVVISQCITELYDQYKGANLNLEFIKSKVVEKMIKLTPELNDPRVFSSLSGRVEDVLHENTNQQAVEAKDDKPAKAAIDGRLYSMRKGKNGGFWRVSDQKT